MSLHFYLLRIEDDSLLTPILYRRLSYMQSSYQLLHQMGKVKRIKKNFELPINEYPIFKLVAIHRTILATETNKLLLEKGIVKFSASGIGDKINVGYREFSNNTARPAFNNDVEYSQTN